MKSLFAALAQKSKVFLLYAFAGSIPAVSNFLLAPVLVRRLGVDGFSVYALTEPVVLIISALLLAGSQLAVLREIASGERTAGAGLGVLLTVIAASFVIVDIPAGFVLAQQFGTSLALVLCFTVVTEALTSSLTYILRAERKIGLLILNEGGRSFGLLALALFFEVTNSASMRTVAYVVLARGVINLAIFCALVFRHLRPEQAKASQIKGVIRYGFPLFASQLVLLLAMNIDRYIIDWLVTDTVGLTSYVVHGKIAGVLGILFLAPLFLWFPVQVMNCKGNLPEHEMVSITAVYASAFISVALVVALATPWFWHFIFPGIGFSELLLVTSMMVIGFQGLGIIWNTGALQPGQTRWNIVPPAIFLACMLSLGPLGALGWQVTGVAVAKVVAMAVYAFSYYWISYRTIGKPGPLLPQLPFAIAGVLCAVLPMAGNRLLSDPRFVAGLLFVLIVVGIVINRAAILKTLKRDSEQAG